MFFGAVFVPLMAPFVAPDLIAGWIRSDHGSEFGPERARRFVRENGPGLAKVMALSARRPLPLPNDAACRELASELGAIEIRFEQRGGASCPVVVFHRWGLGETYEEQLAWVPDDVAADVRASRLRLGEGFEFLADRWWWVWW